jgi:hypothetical protein
VTVTQDEGVDRSSEMLVIPLHLHGLARFFPAIVVGLVVVGAALIAFGRSLDASVYGGLLIVTFGWMCAAMLVARRRPLATRRAFVATADGLRSPWWEVGWDGVDRIWIGRWEGIDRTDRIWVGRSARSSPKALVMETRAPEEVRSYSRNRAMSRARKAPQIVVPQESVDRPLEEIAAAFERLAGRTLIARDNTPA